MKLKKYKNYISLIKNSVGTKMFRNIFVESENSEEDILGDGKRSCAYFVSSVLMIFNLIDNKKAPHAKVEGLLKNMEDFGWEKIDEDNLKAGDIIVWENFKGEGDRYFTDHLGFYIGDDVVISNDSKKRYPIEHHYTYNGKRKIISCWHWPKFE